MQVSADTPKRSRAKAAIPVATPKPAAKSGSSREPTFETSAAMPMIVAADPIDVTGMIATTAYFLAAEREFIPGHELEDWLEAERRVQAQLSS